MTPWWSTLLSGGAGGVLALLGSLVVQLWNGRRAEAERDEHRRERRAEANAELLAAHQQFIVAVAQFFIERMEGRRDDEARREVDRQWTNVSTKGYRAITLATGRTITDEIDRMLLASIPLIQLVHRGDDTGNEYPAMFDAYDAVGQHLGELVRLDAVGDKYWPKVDAADRRRLLVGQPMPTVDLGDGNEVVVPNRIEHDNDDKPAAPGTTERPGP